MTVIRKDRPTDLGKSDGNLILLLKFGQTLTQTGKSPGSNCKFLTVNHPSSHHFTNTKYLHNLQISL